MSNSTLGTSFDARSSTSLDMPGDEGGAPERHVVHASLYRPVLFAGVEPAAAVVEAATAFALVFVVGFHLVTVLLAVFYLTVVHGVMTWVAARDPQMSALYVRSLTARDYYAPHGGLRAPTPRARPAIPPART